MNFLVDSKEQKREFIVRDWGYASEIVEKDWYSTHHHNDTIRFHFLFTIFEVQPFLRAHGEGNKWEMKENFGKNHVGVGCKEIVWPVT